MPSDSSRAIYLDSSALVKLVVAEPETAALMAFLSNWPQRVSSVLARVEVLRSVRRASASAAVRQRAARVLARVALVRIDEPVLASAARLLPPSLRTLDAIHLAAARSLDGLAGIVCYDLRLSRAAQRGGLKVWSPT